MVLVFETTLATYVSRTIYIRTGMVLVFETTLVTNVSSTIYKKKTGVVLDFELTLDIYMYVSQTIYIRRGTEQNIYLLT